ncbi:SDR family oxidoreductase [Streptomyces sp. NBC_01622]|uniref:SDR family oxidoreductase n=1 Tax=Streptomyces sp. NBC_01622 TaxID=2975903 RepID=UPI003866C770|nr:SDR family oxidoreductase [Streptomyces sp. NBC_01622]
MGSVVIIGGTSGIGRELARNYLDMGRPVVITGRDAERARGVAAELAAAARAEDDAGTLPVRGLAVDLSQPHDIAAALADVGPVDRLVLVAIERDMNTIANYDIDKAVRLTTLKLVGYHTVVHALKSRLSPDSSVLLFGGMAKDRPYEGSTTVSTINAGVIGMMRTLAVELAPIRVNSLHTWMIEDSPFWRDKPEMVKWAAGHTLTHRLPTSADVVDAAALLLDNPGLNAVDLRVDCGMWER